MSTTTRDSAVMRLVRGVAHMALIAAVTSAMCGLAFAQLEVKVSEDFDWKYEMDDDPSTQDLDVNGTLDFHLWGDEASFDGGVLNAGNVCYESAEPDRIWENNMTYAEGYTIEMKMKALAEDGPTYPAAVGIWAGAPGNSAESMLRVGLTSVGWGTDDRYVDLGTTFDNSGDFHVFRVVQLPEQVSYSVWRDGVLLGEELGDAWKYTANNMWFPRGSSDFGGTSQVDYVRFTSGAYAPDGGTPPPIPGDANEDGKVTDADAAILATHWQKMGDATWGDGDFNGDGNVTDADAAILATHWQETQESGAPVPEPSTLVLLGGIVLLGLVGLARRWR